MILNVGKFFIPILATSLLLSCNSKTDKKSDNDSENLSQSHQTKRQRLKHLMDSLVDITDPNIEKQVLEEIWQHTYLTHIVEGSNIELFTLSLSANDAIGNKVVNNLQSAKGRITAKLTISNSKRTWAKSVSFTPLDKDNLYLLMRE